MATLYSTQSFETGQTLTADALTNHVVDATPLPDFIAGQDPLTIPATADQLMINDVDGGKIKKITIANLAGNLPATTVASLTVTGNASLDGNTDAEDVTVKTLTSSDEITSGKKLSASEDFEVLGNSTLGSAAVSGTYTRSTTTLTVTKVDHGLDTNDTRWFKIENNAKLCGEYSVTKLTSDTFSIVVQDTGSESGTVSWYEKETNLSSTIAGTIQGDVSVYLTETTHGDDDYVPFVDVSDSNKLKVARGCLPKAWACISIDADDTTTVTASYTVSGNIATISKIAHGLKVGDVLFLNFPGAGFDGWYEITEVEDADTFKVAVGAGLASGTVDWYALTVDGYGVSSAFRAGTGDTTNDTQINLTVPFDSTNYAVIPSYMRNAGTSPGHAAILKAATPFWKTEASFNISTFYSTYQESEGVLMLSVFGNLA